MNPETKQNLAIGGLGTLLVAISLSMPVGHFVERIVFLEDACWTLSWLVIAAASFRERRAGYPAAALAMTFAVELYLCLHYTVIESWPYNPWLLVNYVLWPLCTCFNLLANYRLSRTDYVPDGDKRIFLAKLGGEVAFYFLIFCFFATKIPSELVMLYFGQTVILYISLHFLISLIERKDLRGMSFAGNFFRFLGGLLCYVLNSVIRSPDTYLQIVMPAIVVIDLIFLVLLFVKKRKSAVA